MIEAGVDPGFSLMSSWFEMTCSPPLAGYSTPAQAAGLEANKKSATKARMGVFAKLYLRVAFMVDERPAQAMQNKRGNDYEYHCQGRKGRWEIVTSLTQTV